MHAVRGLAHALVPAGDHHVVVANPDGLVAERHRAQPGPAELVDTVGGALDRDSGVHRGLPGGVLPRACGQDLAHDDLAHLTGLDRGAPHRLLDRDLAEVMRGAPMRGPR